MRMGPGRRHDSFRWSMLRPPMGPTPFPGASPHPPGPGLVTRSPWLAGPKVCGLLKFWAAIPDASSPSAVSRYELALNGLSMPHRHSAGPPGGTGSPRIIQPDFVPNKIVRVKRQGAGSSAPGRHREKSPTAFSRLHPLISAPVLP